MMTDKPTDAPRRGRPPRFADTMDDRLNIRVPRDVMEALRELRDSRKDGADIAQVTRELLVEGLEKRGRL